MGTTAKFNNKKITFSNYVKRRNLYKLLHFVKNLPNDFRRLHLRFCYGLLRHIDCLSSLQN